VTALVHPTCMYQWSENSHTRYSVLLLEELWEKRLPSQYPGRMLKIADTLPFLNNHLHILDRRFKYVEKQTKHSPDCRR
jgi:hypothetical protein